MTTCSKLVQTSPSYLAIPYLSAAKLRKKLQTCCAKRKKAPCKRTLLDNRLCFPYSSSVQTGSLLFRTSTSLKSSVSVIATRERTKLRIIVTCISGNCILYSVSHISDSSTFESSSGTCGLRCSAPAEYGHAWRLPE